MKKTIAIGIDPGSSSGAITVIIDNKVEIHQIKHLTEQDISKVLCKVSNTFNANVYAVIEKVSSMPGQGIASSFKFGINYGFLRGCLVSHEIPFMDYHPKKWQKFYSVAKKATESKTEWKRRLHGIAQNLYPGVKINVSAGDSVLLAHFALSLINNN